MHGENHFSPQVRDRTIKAIQALIGLALRESLEISNEVPPEMMDLLMAIDRSERAHELRGTGLV
jgi:hypothetical protein